MTAWRPGDPATALPTLLAAVMFDLDDTLFPEHAFVDSGFRAVAAFLAPRLGEAPADLLARLWALHARDGRGRLFDALLAEHGAADDEDLVLACVLAYRTHAPRLEPFPGVAELLKALAGRAIRLGLVSDGSPAVQHRKLAALGPVAARFEAVVMTAELGATFGKPSPVPFRVACRLLDVPPTATVYVGNDPRKDFAGARAAGLASIRVGRAPDEGGGRSIVTPPGGDADVAVDDVPALVGLLIAAGVLAEPAAPRAGIPR